MATDLPGVTQAAGARTGQAAHRPHGERSPAPGAPAGTAAAAGDSVRLRTADQLQSLAEALHNVPVVDAQRVQEVRAALSAGKLPVDSHRIAEKLIALESLAHPAGPDEAE